jgi:hypothetical protein
MHTFDVGRRMRKIITVGLALTGAVALFMLISFGLTMKKGIDQFLMEDTIHGSFFPVVRAILEYTEERNAAPKKLIDLVPDHLAEIPQNEFVERIEYNSDEESWTLALNGRDGRIYMARRPTFTEKEIESASSFYHGTWLVKESNQSGDGQ